MNFKNNDCRYLFVFRILYFNFISLPTFVNERIIMLFIIFLFTVVIPNAMYRIYAYSTPIIQDYNLNYCLLSNAYKSVLLGEGCHYFIVHSPGFNRDPRTLSLESVCYPGYYITRKQEMFVLEEKTMGQEFGK